MPVEKKKNGCYHVHNTTTKKCLDKKTANKQLAAIEINKHLHESKIIVGEFIYEAIGEVVKDVDEGTPVSKLIDMYEDDDDGSYLSTIDVSEDNNGTFVRTSSKNPVENAVNILRAAKVSRYNNNYDQSGLWYVGKESAGPNTLYKIGEGWTPEERSNIQSQIG